MAQQKALEADARYLVLSITHVVVPTLTYENQTVQHCFKQSWVYRNTAIMTYAAGDYQWHVVAHCLGALSPQQHMFSGDDG